MKNKSKVPSYLSEHLRLQIFTTVTLFPTALKMFSSNISSYQISNPFPSLMSAGSKKQSILLETVSKSASCIIHFSS